MKKVISVLIIGCLFVSMLAVAFPVTANAGNLGSRILKVGSSGNDVKQLQSALHDKGIFRGQYTGYFGQVTYKSVCNFQKQNSLSADGIVGRATLKALRGSAQTTAQVSRGGNINREDTMLLARAIYSEARGESYMGQVAIAAVILNRLQNPNFPKSIKGIIFQPSAFSAVDDGQFWLEPDQTAFKAAQEAINGWDPTNGAIYYYNPKKTSNSWMLSRKIVAVIGEHLFCK